MIKRFDSSIWLLIVANLVPLVGVLFWDWSTFEVVALYWLENVIIGGVNILKMITCSPDPGLMAAKFEEKVAERNRFTGQESHEIETAREMFAKFGNKAGPINTGIKFFLIPFFAVHYGFFCFGHGMFVFALLGKESGIGGVMKSGPGVGGLPQLVGDAVAQGGIWAALGLLISHLYSFATNFLGKGEYRKISAPQLMAAPYGRIVVLHIAIIFGAFAIMALGSPVFLLVLLIAGKIVLDIFMHLRSHRKLQNKTP